MKLDTPLLERPTIDLFFVVGNERMWYPESAHDWFPHIPSCISFRTYSASELGRHLSRGNVYPLWYKVPPIIVYWVDCSFTFRDCPYLWAVIHSASIGWLLWPSRVWLEFHQPASPIALEQLRARPWLSLLVLRLQFPNRYRIPLWIVNQLGHCLLGESLSMQPHQSETDPRVPCQVIW